MKDKFTKKTNQVIKGLCKIMDELNSGKINRGESQKGLETHQCGNTKASEKSQRNGIPEEEALIFFSPPARPGLHWSGLFH